MSEQTTQPEAVPSRSVHARRAVKSLIGKLIGEHRTHRAGMALHRYRAGVHPLNASYWPNASRLHALKDRHRGQRCFIIGNGPSLKNTDLSFLQNEVTFGLNRIYLAFPETGWATTYHVCFNRYVIDQCREEIAALPIPKFLPWDRNDTFGNRPDLHYLYTESGLGFITNLPWHGVHEGATVTYAAMQIAYWMGFAEVVLIGVDHSFATKGPANKLVTSTGDDPNHFHAAYFGKGFKWQLPDLDTSEISYEMARRQFQSAGRRIIDATVGGKLTIFPKVEYLSLFTGDGQNTNLGASRNR